MIEINHVDKWYGPGFQALKDCTTSVAKGEVVVVCGPSGSGKSTLIKCVNALEPFQGGEIILDGIKVNDPKTDLPKLRARVGMVFQHFELFPHLKIIENLCLAQEKVLGRSHDEAVAKAEKLLDRVGLKEHAQQISRPNCPAASSSASPSPARWRWTRSPCCSTSRPRRSIPK